MKRIELKQAELRNIIREVVLAELYKQSKRLFLNQSGSTERIAKIEAREEKNAITISKLLINLECQMRCGVTTGHRITLVRKQTYCYVFRCANCELEYNRADDSLTDKEKELVATVYGKELD